METLTEKKCISCKELKPFEEFYKESTDKDGYGGYCKICCKQRAKEYRKTHPREYNEATKQWMRNNPDRIRLSRLRQSAKKRNIEFNLDINDIIVPETCPILGIPLERNVLTNKTGPRPNSPSVDRIDSSKGYVKGNVQVISMKANAMKQNATPNELIKFATWINNNVKTIPK